MELPAHSGLETCCRRASFFFLAINIIHVELSMQASALSPKRDVTCSACFFLHTIYDQSEINHFEWADISLYIGEKMT